MAVILRGEERFFIGRHHGYRFSERVSANDNAAGVDAALPNGTGKFFCELDDLLRRGRSVLHFVEQFGAFREGFFDGDFRGFWHERG